MQKGAISPFRRWKTMNAPLAAPALFALGIATAGCFLQTSVHPFVSEHDGVVIPALAGQWVEAGDAEDDDPDSLELTPAISRTADTWTLRYRDKADEPPAVLEVRLGRLGDHLVWDMTLPEDKEEPALSAVHRLPLHSLARISLEGDRLELAFLDPKWFSTRAAEGALEVAHLEIEKDNLLLTAPTEELRAAVLTSWDEAFGDTAVFVRRKVNQESAR
jgi:hypothetical protein